MTSALRNKPRPVGGLKKNIMMYQQNRREVRKSLQENKQHHRSCLLEELTEDSDKQQLLQPGETNKRVSSSAGQFTHSLTHSLVYEYNLYFNVTVICINNIIVIVMGDTLQSTCIPYVWWAQEVCTLYLKCFLCSLFGDKNY